ncbi:glycine betaine ABC transporter substrate-binding protein [Streptomyces sp. NPDC055085]
MLAPPNLTVGNIDLSCHRAAAAAIHHVLEETGHAVHRLEAPLEHLFDLLGSGEVDVLVSAWLPTNHTKYLERYLGRVQVLAPLYAPFYSWAVPEYIPKEVVAEIGDLARPDIASQMTLALDGINPEAEISQFSAQIISAYGLDSAGYTFQPGTEQSFNRRVERGISEREWFVIPIWRPQYLNAVHGLRALVDPKKILRIVDIASPVITRAALQRIKPRAMERLLTLCLGNDGVETIGKISNVNHLSLRAAAARYLQAERTSFTPIHLE